VSDPSKVPQPWYYQPLYRQRFYMPARALRNLGLMAGYFSGIAWLLASQAALVMFLATPDALASLYSRYPAAPWGAGTGLGLGIVAALLYRTLAPQNRKAPRVVIPLLTGWGGIMGLGYALLGAPGGQLTVLLCALSAASFFYIEGYPSEK
jgi:hypothetical protein